LNGLKPVHSLDELSLLWKQLKGEIKTDVVLEVFLDSLQPEELGVLNRTVAGEGGQAIAKDLGIAVFKVRKNLDFALASLQLATLEQLQLRFIAAGIKVA